MGAASARCYVKAYYDWIEQTAALEDDEKGRLFVAILEYARSGEIPDNLGRESLLFPVFKSVVDRDAQNLMRWLRMERLAAEHQKQMQANVSKRKQMQANVSLLIT